MDYKELIERDERRKKLAAASEDYDEMDIIRQCVPYLDDDQIYEALSMIASRYFRIGKDVYASGPMLEAMAGVLANKNKNLWWKEI